jgi:hypothetical protein
MPYATGWAGFGLLAGRVDHLHLMAERTRLIVVEIFDGEGFRRLESPEARV